MVNSLTLDPRLFHPDAIDEETAAFTAQLEEQFNAVPGLYEPQSAPTYRALLESVMPPVICDGAGTHS